MLKRDIKSITLTVREVNNEYSRFETQIRGSITWKRIGDLRGSAHDRDADGRLAEGASWPAPAVAVQSLTLA